MPAVTAETKLDKEKKLNVNDVENTLTAFASEIFVNGTLEITRIDTFLIVEAPDQKLKQYDWDNSARHLFDLNDAEVDALEHNAVVWRGSTAFLLERESYHER